MQQRSEHINHELQQLQNKLLRMAALSKEAIENAVRTMKGDCAALAKSVIDGDQIINQLEVDIEQEGLKFIALYQPEAIDLRTVISILRMVTDIERIGDLAVNIARSSLELTCKDDFTQMLDLPYLADMVLSMYQDALHSFVDENIELAKKTIESDKNVNQLCNQFFRELIVHMMQNPQKISSYIQFLLVSRHLERVGDHCKNIAEVTYFITHGKNIKHHQNEI